MIQLSPPPQPATRAEGDSSARTKVPRLASAALNLDTPRGCLRRRPRHPDLQHTIPNVAETTSGDVPPEASPDGRNCHNETHYENPYQASPRLLSRRSTAIVSTPLSTDTSMSRSGSTPGTSALTHQLLTINKFLNPDIPERPIHRPKGLPATPTNRLNPAANGSHHPEPCPPSTHPHQPAHHQAQAAPHQLEAASATFRLHSHHNLLSQCEPYCPTHPPITRHIRYPTQPTQHISIHPEASMGTCPGPNAGKTQDFRPCVRNTDRASLNGGR